MLLCYGLTATTAVRMQCCKRNASRGEKGMM